MPVPSNGQVQLRVPLFQIYLVAHARALAASASQLIDRLQELSICNAVPYRASTRDQEYQMDDTTYQ